MITTKSDFEKKLADFVARHRWYDAVTYAKFCPHQYVVKGRLPKDEQKVFEEIAQGIRDFGFMALYGTQQGMYYILGEHYYWTMGAPIPETTILNRARLSDFALIDNRWIFVGGKKG